MFERESIEAKCAWISGLPLQIRRQFEQLALNGRSWWQIQTQSEREDALQAALSHPQTTHSHTAQPAVTTNICNQLAQWRSRGGQVQLITDQAYPPTLRLIADPPLLIYVKGALAPQLYLTPTPRALAIVGSRAATPELCTLTTDIAAHYANREVVIVSGLALGIDTAAHSGALTANTPHQTIAVLGNGLNQIYPPRNQRLAEEILSNGGAIISQFLPDTPPYPANFLDRNRVIAGLSAATLVIGAALRSGALVTARHANEQGREVYCLPGAVNDPLSAGTNRLIRDGAHPWLEYSDLDHLFGPTNASQQKTPLAQSTFTPNELEVIAALRTGNQAVHERAGELTEATRRSLHQILLKLELSGVVRRIPGNLYELTSQP